MMGSCKLGAGAMAMAVMMLGCASVAPAPEEDEKKLPRVLMVTEHGEIEIELEIERAPETVANFMRYVDGGFYTGGRIHRTVTMQSARNQASDFQIEVIQGGINPEKNREAREEFEALALERTRDTMLEHRDGTISMARGGPDSARSDFFICIGDQPSLDFGGMRNADGQGFAAFGRVVRGMDVVKKIQMSPANDREGLTPPITIERVSKVEDGATNGRD